MNNTNLTNHKNWRKQLTLFCLGLGLVSLVYSPFLLSISMFGVIFLGFFDFSAHHKLVLDTTLRKKWKLFWQTPSFWALLLVFIPIFYSGLYSENYAYWLERSRIKLPFLGLPIAFFFLPKLTAKDYRKIAVFYITIMVLSAFGVLVNYILHFEHINGLIGKGQNIPVPRNHIRFSLGIAIALMMSIGLYFDESPISKWQKKLALGSVIFLFLFQHLLAVRSGIAGMYLGLFVYLVKSLRLPKYRLLGWIGFILLLVLPFMAQKTIPSLKTKVGYMLYDWKMRQQGKGDHYSDSGRIASMQAGMRIGHQHPLLGIGAGDLRDEMDKYLSEYLRNRALIPHNEFIFYYATTGIVGLILFLWGVLTAIYYRKNYKNTLFLSIQLILLFSFLVEATLETSTGTGYYLFWTLIGLLFIRDSNSTIRTA
ncbi:MAG TPA: hypothetical protein ENK85_09525 [Saprospiraceae bacterium]|nr:hypothetical protein [Saprospiraceae bacterium]